MSDEVLYADVKFCLHQNQGTGITVAGSQGEDVIYSGVKMPQSDPQGAPKGGVKNSEGADEKSGGGAKTREGTDEKFGGVTMTSEGRSLRLPLLVLVCLCVLLVGLTIALGVLYATAITHQQSIEGLNSQITSNLTAQRDSLLTELQGYKENLTIVSERLGNCTSEWRNCTRACGPGWRVNNTSCYFFSKEKKTWSESQYECIRAGGHLVVISSREEQEFVRGVVGNADFDRSYWIGMTDEREEGLWVWMDNTTLTDQAKFWDGNEPNNKDGDQTENCARIGQNCNGNINCWFDNQCTRQSRWICESQAGCKAT